MTMKPTVTPVFRAAASSILRSFLNMQMGEKTGNKFVSETAAGIHKKRHLVITGSREIGKSTLLREILALPYFSDLGPFPGFTTQAFPRDRVELTDNLPRDNDKPLQ